MRESPRTRRLRSDLKALQQLAAESSIFEFSPYGTPPDFYILRFRGRGFWKPEPTGEVVAREEHEVHVRLGASYPRMMPELAWKSPIFHPNISASGVVCLGGYGTYWVPSLSLDELCGMLWDMIRYENFDESSPYNREAAAWAKGQTFFRLPIDDRPLRNKLAKGKSIDDFLPRLAPLAEPSKLASPRPGLAAAAIRPPAVRPAARAPQPAPDVVFLGDVVEAEAAVHALRPVSGDGDILFIE
jgi:ubiquitin-protein ligase